MSRGKTKLFLVSYSCCQEPASWSGHSSSYNYYPKVSLVLIMENGDLDGDPFPSRRLFMFG